MGSGVGEGVGVGLGLGVRLGVDVGVALAVPLDVAIGVSGFDVADGIAPDPVAVGDTVEGDSPPLQAVDRATTAMASSKSASAERR